MILLGKPMTFYEAALRVLEEAGMPHLEMKKRLS